jgi:hypothetical protein
MEGTMAKALAKPTLGKEEHLALIKVALEASLTARTQYDAWQDEQRASQPLPRFELIPYSYYLETSAEKIRLDSLTADPVRYALRKQVRALGKELYQLLGNTNAMLVVAEELAAKDFGYRMNIIDKAWDGIGHWYA